MGADLALTHRIPHAVCTTDAKDFIKLREALKVGIVLLEEHSDVKIAMSAQGPVIFYTWYGEEACTKEKYDHWANRPKLLKV